MKYHKIKNVPLEVCTAEAKIAYNGAFLDYREILEVYNKCTCNFQRADIIREGVQLIMNRRILHNVEICKKYNIDAIQSCLNIGLENYLNEKYHILSSYKEIGQIFKSAYL